MANSAATHAFDASLIELLRRNTLLLAYSSLVAGAAFTLIEDITTFDPADAVRLGAMAAFSALVFTFRRERSQAAVVAFAFAVHLVAVFALCGVIVFTGGAHSQYLPAFYVMSMIPALFFCYRPQYLILLQLGIFAPALVTTILLSSSTSLTLVRAAFLTILSAMSAVVGYANYRVRRRDFENAESLREADEELRNTQGQLIQAEKLSALGTLSACVAHELNQPLTVLLGYTALISKRLRSFSGSTEEAQLLQQHAEMVRHGAERMSEIINRMRNFARRSERATVPVSLNDVARGALFFVESELAESGVALEVNLTPEPALVRADPTELEQVMLNLLTNARDAVAGRPGARVRVATAVALGRGMIEVEDSGPGVPEEARPLVFTPFFTTKPTGQGTGLGLAVSRLIVGRHGGQIELLTAAPRGALFRVTFPLVAADATASQPAPTAIDEPSPVAVEVCEPTTGDAPPVSDTPSAQPLPASRLMP